MTRKPDRPDDLGEPAEPGEPGELGELGELRDAWRALEPRSPADGLEETDAATRASVLWLRDAWRELEVPRATAAETLGVRALARRSARPVRRFGPRLVAGIAALAAAVLLALLAGFRLRERAAEPAPRPGPYTFPASEPARIAALSPDHIELRSGAVTLVLVTALPGRSNKAGPKGEPR